jgi:hypothetical protein
LALVALVVVLMLPVPQVGQTLRLVLLQHLVAGEAEFIYPVPVQAAVLVAVVAQQRVLVVRGLSDKVMLGEQQAVQELAAVGAQGEQVLF